jgi:hypothetical protein
VSDVAGVQPATADTVLLFSLRILSPYLLALVNGATNAGEGPGRKPA